MSQARQGLLFSVAVAALGYFVDLYDIVIFGVVRVASLTALGISGADITRWGITLFNLQMTGMLVGGIAWGLIGDRLGRRAALLATISLYSAANIANGCVVSVGQYAVLRFVAGVGLAGELGAGVTLVAELLPREHRGYGTTVISFLGLVGALAASWIGSWFDWRTAYFAGGGVGLLVLAGRWWGLRESNLFTAHRGAHQGAHQGQTSQWQDLRQLLGRGPSLRRLLAVVAVGVPIWYVLALFVGFAPEFGKALGVSAPLKVGEVLSWQATGLAIGSACSGLAGEWLRSRKRVIWICFAAMAALVLAILLRGRTPAIYCRLMFAMGLAQGYWTVFLTMSAEQFGTNVRATVSTSVPNFVRAMTVPVTLLLQTLAPLLGVLRSTMAIGTVVLGLAVLALLSLQETFGRDLAYVEDLCDGRDRRDRRG